jgi:hypothetical protein
MPPRVQVGSFHEFRYAKSSWTARSAICSFVEFFSRSDSAASEFGLETAQWTSIGLLLIAGAGAWITARRRQSTQ